MVEHGIHGCEQRIFFQVTANRPRIHSLQGTKSLSVSFKTTEGTAGKGRPNWPNRNSARAGGPPRLALVSRHSKRLLRLDAVLPRTAAAP
jgi:hypothetical protein